MLYINVLGISLLIIFYVLGISGLVERHSWTVVWRTWKNSSKARQSEGSFPTMAKQERVLLECLLKKAIESYKDEVLRYKKGQMNLWHIDALTETWDCQTAFRLGILHNYRSREGLGKPLLIYSEHRCSTYCHLKLLKTWRLIHVGILRSRLLEGQGSSVFCQIDQWHCIICLGEMRYQSLWMRILSTLVIDMKRSL